MRGVTDAYEKRLWKELNILLADAVPANASESAAENAITAAVAGADAEIADLYRRVVTLSRADSSGFIRQRMEEDNVISAARLRLGQGGEHRTPSKTFTLSSKETFTPFRALA
jgi:hypothetical protein